MIEKLVGPMLIKDVPLTLRDKANQFAKNRDENLSAWVIRAISAQINIESGDLVEPTKFERRVSAAKLAVPQEALTVDAKPLLKPIADCDLAGLMQGLAAMASVHGKRSQIVSEARHLMAKRLREASGKAEPKPRLAPRPKQHALTSEPVPYLDQAAE